MCSVCYESTPAPRCGALMTGYKLLHSHWSFLPVVKECGDIIGPLISIVSGFRTHTSSYVNFTQLINLLLAVLGQSQLLC